MYVQSDLDHGMWIGLNAFFPVLKDRYIIYILHL
jgi:hypothetical protein